MNEGYSLINLHLQRYIEELDCPLNLKKSMEYSISAGGKRIRPLLLFAVLHAFKKDITLGIPVASAIEMIHTYSLIHDDLPSMDNDDLRRGKPTNHKVFGEATAILAGDGLLTYSFQVIAELTSPEVSDMQKLQLIAELAKAAGPEGMVAGQVADMEGENQDLNLTDLEYIHTHKTGKLLNYSIKAGAILAGADTKVLNKLGEFAYHIGLAFQIQDDILDVEGSQEELGKTVGKDESINKSTYPKLLSLAGAKQKLAEHIAGATAILDNLHLDTEHLRYITELIGKRKN